MKKIFSFDAETDGLWGNPFAVAAIVYEYTPDAFGSVFVAHHSDRMPGSYKYLRPATEAEFSQRGNAEWCERSIYENFQIQDSRESWKETARFIGRLSDDVVSDNWVRENVLPTLADVPVTHQHHIGGGDHKMGTAAGEKYCNQKAYEAMLQDFANFYNAHKTGADIICHMGYIVEAHLLREMRRLGFIGDWNAPYPLLDVSGNLQAAGEDPTSVDGYAKKHGLHVADYGTTHNPLYDCEVAAKAYIHLNQ